MAQRRAWLRAAGLLAALVLVLVIALVAMGGAGPLDRFGSGPLRVGPGFTGDPTTSDRPCLGNGAPAVCATP